MSARITEAMVADSVRIFKEEFHRSSPDTDTYDVALAKALRPVLAAALSTESGEAEGWRLVPLHPTPDMLGAWYRYKSGFHYHDEPPPPDTSDVGAYAAMLAAAPLPEDTHHGR